MAVERSDITMNKYIFIDGDSLTIEQIIHVARNRVKVKISADGIKKMTVSRNMVDVMVERQEVVYGITTGFGKFSNINICQEKTEKLQENLIVSHAVGMGDPIPEEVVRAIMLLRANTLAKGFSGIRPEIVETLIEMLNLGVHPVIPEKGSLGASGDLAPLAHMVLVMLGKGECFYLGERLPGGLAMQRAGIPIVALKAKEGLALINGTQVMTAFGVLALYDSQNLAKTADIIAAATCEALEAIISAFDSKVHEVRPHPGQLAVAKNMRQLLEDSEIINKAKHGRVQDAYALRCIPQVHGATRDTIDYVRKVLEIEINSVTDNPILFPEQGEVISGGNFHGQPLAFAMDYLAIAMAELANISERRTERLVNPSLSDLPAFLTENGGINCGFMICQYVAASLVSENKVLAHPASVDSIPSSANQEDHVSMGTIAARKAREIIKNVKGVLAIELLCAIQGIDLRGGKPSSCSSIIYKEVRGSIPVLEEDREIRLDIEQAVGIIDRGILVHLVEGLLPSFN